MRPLSYLAPWKKKIIAWKKEEGEINSVDSYSVSKTRKGEMNSVDSYSVSKTGEGEMNSVANYTVSTSA